MSAQTVANELSQLLRRAVESAGKLAMERMQEGNFEGAKAAMDCAQGIDLIRGRIETGQLLNGERERARSVPPVNLPYYYREPDQLMKIGPSTKGDGTYRHSVPRNHFDRVMEVLVALAKSDHQFETQQLLNRLPGIPGHQPRIVLDVLEQHNVLRSSRRGHWTFADRPGFASAARAMWDRISTAPA